MQINLNKTPYYAYTANQELVAQRDTIIFVHGAAMEHSVWSHQSRYFAYQGYNIAAVDLPGHNLSGGKLLNDIAEMAHWLCEIIACVIKMGGGYAVHLVGHSMGALIALEAAATLAGVAENSRPKPNIKSNAKPTPAVPLVKSLCLIGFSYPMAVTPQLLGAAQHDPSAAYAMMTQWSHASKIGGEPLPGFWSPGLQMSMLENSKHGAVFADLTACNNYVGGEQAFASINRSASQPPTLFISGALDRMAPAKLAAAQAAKNKHAESVFIPNCGHNLMAESPDGVLHELKRFISQQTG